MKSKVDELKAAYDREECPCLEEYDPHTVASLLKQYLRELPENLLGRDLAQRFEDACGRQVEAEKVTEFQRLLAEVPPQSRLILSWLVTHMEHVIVREADTKMNIQNISIVLNPTIQVREGEQVMLSKWNSRLIGKIKESNEDSKIKIMYGSKIVAEQTSNRRKKKKAPKIPPFSNKRTEFV